MKQQIYTLPRRTEPQPGGRRQASPPEPPKKKKRKKPRRSLPVRLAMGFYKLLVVLSVLILAGFAAWRFLPEPGVGGPDIAPAPDPGQSAPQLPSGGEDASSPGADEPAGRQRRKQVYNFVLLGKDVDSGNTDSIIVVSYDVPGRKVGMISIPRDTAVERSWRKNPKINGAFYGAGPDTLKEEIQHTFGIPIDYYVLVDLKGFIALVDELEGVDVDIPVDMNYDDPYQNLHIHFSKGPNQHLDGQKAMEAARYRHDNNNPDGSPGPNQDYTDVGRAAMQRQILTQLAKKVVSWNSLTKVTSFVDIFRTYVKTDLSAADMAWFAAQAVQVDVASAVRQGVLEGDGNSRCRGFSYCFTFRPEDVLPVLNELVNPYDQPLTEADLHLPQPD